LNQATYCISQAFSLQLFLGANLRDTEASFRNFYDRTIEIGQKSMILCLKPYFQSILNQQTVILDWNNIAVLSGEVMEEEEYLSEVDEAANPVLKVVTYLLKAELAEKFGKLPLAEFLYSFIEKSGRSICFSHAVVPWWGSAGHAYYRIFLASGKRLHLRKARIYKKRLEKLLDIGCKNAASSVAYLRATEASVCGLVGDSELLKILTQECQVITASSHIKMEASVHEEAGFACLRRGLQYEAQQYLKRALSIYEQLGAFAKYHWLREKAMSHQLCL
jgi:hypothetical protein